MNITHWLAQAEKQLQAVGIGTARLDALVLLEEVLAIDRARLLAEPTIPIGTAQANRLKKLLTQRLRHEPLAYVLGRTEFYGRQFVITPAVLEPRPESETMIDLLKQLPDLPARPQIADIGAGSGALGITAALEAPQAHVELLEIDPKAAKVAKINVDKFTLNIPVILSDLLARTGHDYDILLCNLPYVPDDYQINLAALHEPRLAIFGGPDGLDIYRKLFKQVKNLPQQPLYILTEALPFQHDELASIAGNNGFQLQQKNDFIQVFYWTH
jgi:release factor glutamine methyltransferase